MMIAIAADHAGFPLKEEVKKHLEEKGIPYIDCGTDSAASVDFAYYAQKACLMVTNGAVDMALLFCGTGVGMSMAANKVKGIRAACCSDYFSAKLTRMHNNANVLCVGARVVGTGLAMELVDVFLDTPFEGGRHQRRIDQITAIENGALL